MIFFFAHGTVATEFHKEKLSSNIDRVHSDSLTAFQAMNSQLLFSLKWGDSEISGDNGGLW